MPSPAGKTDLALVDLGPTPQAALRHIVDEFERRGWRDDGASALAVVRLLQDAGGRTSWHKAVNAVPRSFLNSNHLYRRDLEEALRRAASRHQAT